MKIPDTSNQVVEARDAFQGVGHGYASGLWAAISYQQQPSMGGVDDRQ
jgi:hypothetical protein